MDSRVEHGMDKKVAMLALYILNAIFMGMHICLLLFFVIHKVPTMALFNVFSVAYYAAAFWLLKKNWNRIYMLVTSVEIMVHMCTAILCLGWNYGFQIYFIGCIAAVFYMDYFSVKLGGKHFSGAPFSIISCILYFVMLFVAKRSEPLYEISPRVELGMFVINSLMVFLFVAFFYGALTRIALRYEAVLSREASHDRLTGLVNRNYLTKVFEEIEEEKETTNYWLAIMDVDNFKRINDTYGHNAGDYVLKRLAELVHENCGEATASRWGGEEFIILGRREKQADGAEGEEEDVMQYGSRAPERLILEKIRTAIAKEEFVYEGQTIRLTVTLGSAVREEDQTVDEWISAADAKMYLGKKRGKNQVVV